MISRRQFTVTLVLTPVAAWLGGCGGGDDGGDGTTGSTSPTEPPAPAPNGCDGVGAQSSVVNGHTHEVCVPLSDLTSPPAAGATYTTSTSDGHTHRITLDAAQLAAVNRGEVVSLQTSLDDQHVHSYTLARAGTIAPDPQPGTGAGPGPY